jgi:hypothetical protein
VRSSSLCEELEGELEQEKWDIPSERMRLSARALVCCVRYGVSGSTNDLRWAAVWVSQSVKAYLY